MCVLIIWSTATFNCSGDSVLNPKSGRLTARPVNRNAWSATGKISFGDEGCPKTATLTGAFKKPSPCEAMDLTHQFSPRGGRTENPGAETSIRWSRFVTTELCAILQSKGTGVKPAAPQKAATVRYRNRRSSERIFSSHCSRQSFASRTLTSQAGYPRLFSITAMGMPQKKVYENCFLGGEERQATASFLQR